MKHVLPCYDEYQEGNAWKPLHNANLTKHLNTKLHEHEELVLSKSIALCLNWDDVINRRSKVLCSQGSLVVIEDFIADEDVKLNGAEIIIVPPEIRLFYETGDNWGKTQLD